MRKKITWSTPVIALTTVLTACHMAEMHKTSLKHLPIDPVQASQGRSFAGTGNDTRVEFVNFSSGQPVEVFPETPVIVRSTSKGTQCRIEDGGVWVRNAVFLSQDERLLVTLEFSGSNEYFVSYDTLSCAKQAQLDISGGRWRLRGPYLEVGRRCTGDSFDTCTATTQYSLSQTGIFQTDPH